MPLFKGVAGKAKAAKAIDYITDERKAAFVSSQALDDNSGYAAQFSQTARLFGKGETYAERKYYHFKLSPNPSDCASPEQVHKLTEEMAAKCFPAHECVIATHTDRQHIHAHIIVNAVSFEDGRKLRIPTSEYTRMKDLANEVGLQYGFSPIDFRKPSKDKIKSTEKQMLLRGGIGWKDELKDVISATMKSSSSFELFAQHLQNYGVTIERNTSKTISFKHPEKQKPIRGNSLGEDFTKEAIVRGIDEYANRAIAHAEKPTAAARTATTEGAVASVGRAITGGVGKHDAQTDLDRIHGAIRDIKDTAERFSPTNGAALSERQVADGENAKQHFVIQQSVDRQYRKRNRGFER